MEELGKALVEIIGGGLVALATVAPSVVLAFTGGQDPKAAIKAAREAATALEQREAKDGNDDGGDWDRDLRERVKRG
jgi:hypothetical protein